jgi:hypothetical protein
VQAETMRMRIRRSSGFSWDRSVIAAAPPSQQLLGLSFMNGRHPGDPLRLNPNSGSVYPACASGVALFGGLFCRPPPREGEGTGLFRLSVP